MVGRPSPVVPVAGLTAAPDDVVVPASDTLASVIDGHLVVFERVPRQGGGGTGVLLNASAALIYTAFDGEVTVAQVVAQLAEETGMDAALLQSDVRSTVDRLLAQGLVTLAGTQEEESPPAAPSVARDPDRWRPVVERLLAERSWAFDSGPRQLAATSVAVRADDPETADLLRLLLSSLPEVAEAPGAGPVAAEHRLSVVSGRRPRRRRVVLDGRVLARVDTPEAAVVHALHGLDELAVSGSPGALLFHAGAVERDGKVVVVLGLSGKGKSTLTAALVRRGFRYLTDEIVAVDVGTREVRPYPKALDLHPGSLDLLGLDADAASLELGGAKGKVLPEWLGEVGSGGSPALLVFLAETLAPAAGAGSAPVEVVPPAEALVAILPVTFEPTIDEPGNFEALAALCESTPAIRIGRAPLDAVLAEVEAALERTG
jgi:hypothetical protein